MEALTHDCAQLYREQLASEDPGEQKAAWGALSLVGILCGARLCDLAGLYPDTTPGELFLLVQQGVTKGRAPWSYAESRLWSLYRRGPARLAASAKRHPIGAKPPVPVVARLDFQRAWAALRLAVQ